MQRSLAKTSAGCVVDASGMRMTFPGPLYIHGTIVFQVQPHWCIDLTFLVLHSPPLTSILWTNGRIQWNKLGKINCEEYVPRICVALALNQHTYSPYLRCDAGRLPQTTSQKTHPFLLVAKI